MKNVPLRPQETPPSDSQLSGLTLGNKSRFAFLAGMVLAATAFRFIPHPPNFSPIASLALFAGASFASKRFAFLVPLLSMALSDIILGFSWITPIIYGSFALIVCLGFWLRHERTTSRIAITTIAGSFLFYLLTNFGVWALGYLYPKNWTGLIDCYLAAIPFFRNTLTSGLLYSALLFGGLALAEKRFARLREPAITAS